MRCRILQGLADVQKFSYLVKMPTVIRYLKVGKISPLWPGKREYALAAQAPDDSPRATFLAYKILKFYTASLQCRNPPRCSINMARTSFDQNEPQTIIASCQSACTFASMASLRR